MQGCNNNIGIPNDLDSSSRLHTHILCIYKSVYMHDI